LTRIQFSAKLAVLFGYESLARFEPEGSVVEHRAFAFSGVRIRSTAHRNDATVPAGRRAVNNFDLQ
jgi:hypothetical protein